MSSAIRNRRVAEVDAFLDEPKRLRGEPPLWEQGSRARERHASWPIVDSLDIERAHLRFRVSVGDRQYPSVSVIFRGNPIWRVDLVRPTECKSNPIWARQCGVPATVCGSHGHEWPDNREFILRGDAWDLPCRRPLPPNIRRLPQLLPWLAGRIGLQLGDFGRDFDVPAPADLFGR